MRGGLAALGMSRGRCMGRSCGAWDVEGPV